MTYTKTKVSRNVVLESDDYQVAYPKPSSGFTQAPDPISIRLTATANGFENEQYLFEEIAQTKLIDLSTTTSLAVGDKIITANGATAIVFKVDTANSKYEITDIVGTISNGDTFEKFTDSGVTGTLETSGGISTTFHSTTIQRQAYGTTNYYDWTTTSNLIPSHRFFRRKFQVSVRDVNNVAESAGGQSDSDVYATDSITIFGTQDGEDHLTAFLTNESHTFQSDENGYVSSFTGSGTDIKVFHGNDVLSFGTTSTNYPVSYTHLTLPTNREV